jgi:hypothetical protein
VLRQAVTFVLARRLWAEASELTPRCAGHLPAGALVIVSFAGGGCYERVVVAPSGAVCTAQADEVVTRPQRQRRRS